MTRRDAAALVLLAGLVTLMFADVLFFGRAFYFRDVTRFYYPMSKVARDIILSGEFPSWNPYLSEGQPLAANPSYAVFYPPNWLLLLPNFELAFRLHVVLHYYLAAIGIYALLRAWRLRIASAIFGACAYTFGGLLLSLTCLLPYLFCLAWLPWLVFFLGRPSRRDTALAAICLAMILLGGEPVTIAQCILIAALSVERRASPRAVLVLIAGLLIASVQIVPAADLLRDSVRSRGFTFQLVQTWSTPPLKAAELFIPEVLGPTGRHAAFYWGTAVYGWLDPFFLSVYPGLLVAALAVAALFLRRRGWVIVAVAAAGGFILALGSHTPLLRMLYDARIFSSFRYPEKFLILVIVPLTVFAAFAFERLLEGDEKLARVATIIAVVTMCVCALLAVATLSPSYMDAFIRFWGIEVHPQRRAIAALSLAVWLSGFARAIVVVMLLLARRRVRAEVWAGVAIAVLVVDLGMERPRVGETIEHEFFSQRPATIPKPRTDVRLFHQADWYGMAGIARAYLDLPEMYWVIRNGAYPHVGATYGVESALNRDVDRTALLPTADLTDALLKLRPRNPRWYEPLMAMSNAAYRAMYLPMTMSGRGTSIRPIIFVPTPTNPRFYFADSIAPPGEFLTRLAANQWTPRIAFIDGVRIDGGGEVLRVAQLASFAHLRVRSDGDALLICSITRHKYWRATIDGRPAELLPVNVAYQALRVPRGLHDIRLRYENPLVRWFGIVSLLSFATVVAVIAVNRGPRDRGQGDRAQL
ncbi:MAG TPA: hypothetical protein VLV78_12085 [Thermoanaerobaculia bacterium]|nr:hypothetical protein [Thermoanaerobaculia bacterium]